MIDLIKGARFAPLIKAPITREQLRLYADASLDTNPIHLDEATALKNGLPGVIAHGMLTMAFLGEFLHQTLTSLGNGRISDMSCRFKGMTFPGDVVTVNGSVRSIKENHIECDFEARNQNGELTANGHATLILD